MSGLIGRKLGMTQIFSDTGAAVAVTVIEAGPCPVLQVKTERAADFALDGVTLRDGGGVEACADWGGLAARTAGEITLTRNVLSRNIAGSYGVGAGGGAHAHRQ